MSHLKIPRKRLSSPGIKLHSEQSRDHYIKRSLGKITHENVINRRVTTHNSSPRPPARQLQSGLEEAKRVYQSKNTKKALPLFHKLHQQFPTSAQIPYFLGSCLLNEGQFEAALNYFRISLQQGPSRDKNVHIYMAICYKALEDYPAALTILEEATIKNPQFEDAYFYKGKIHAKIKNFPEAASNFKKCIAINPLNQLAHIHYADSLRAYGKNKQAISRYQKVIALDGKQKERAFLKKISLLLEGGDFHKAENEIKRAELFGIQSPQIKYYQGVVEFERGNLVQASVCLELSLTDSNRISTAAKSLRVLMQIAISQKDFFGAEHLVNRTMKMEIKDEQNILLCTVIEGINDLIKRKFCQCSVKLVSILEKSSRLKDQKLKNFIIAYVNPYLAYCFFSQERYNESFAIFQALEGLSHEEQAITKFNKQICEGVLLHKQLQFTLAEYKFTAASLILPTKIQPIFLNCINIIRILKDEKASKEELFHKLEALLEKADSVTPPQSLFFFYKSLVYLYQGRDACQVIDFAIEKSDQEVSEYFFIQGLSYSLIGQTLKGLKSINKAIELDSNIPQFYKERSKYYYVLERYEEAVNDVLQVIIDNEDEQAKLLLTFYYYMTGLYNRSLEILEQISNAATGDRFKDFESAIMFRLGRYHQCNLPGNIVMAITNEEKLSPEFIKQVNDILKDRCCYAEFSTYHFHLLLACYYCYSGLFDQCLDHLFGCLEEIQNNFTDQSDYVPFSDSLLCEIKFNIVIVNLCKDCQQPNSKEQLMDSLIQESYKYIQLFMSETEDADFLQCMGKIMHVIKPLALGEHNHTKEEETTIVLLKGQDKISDCFPEIEISLPNGLIRTKMMMMYPQKLKFNICPEFDDSFLFNFDMEKVDTKLCPPWYNLCQGEILFTEQIRNESVMISETEKSSTPLLLGEPASLRDKFKLGESVERKLEKLMRKGGRRIESR